MVTDEQLIARVREALDYLDTLYIKSEMNHKRATTGSQALDTLARRLKEAEAVIEAAKAWLATPDISEVHHEASHALEEALSALSESEE